MKTKLPKTPPNSPWFVKNGAGVMRYDHMNIEDFDSWDHMQQLQCCCTAALYWKMENARLELIEHRDEKLGKKYTTMCPGCRAMNKIRDNERQIEKWDDLALACAREFVKVMKKEMK